MRHPGKRRNTRLIAVVMLLLWMFVLGSGIAHACLSDAGHRDGALHRHRTAAPSDPAIAGAVAQHDHAGKAAHAAHAAWTDCSHSDVTACAAVTELAPAPTTGRSVGKLADPEFDAAVATVWQAFAVAVERRPAAHRHRKPDPGTLPVYLRFLRLTL